MANPNQYFLLADHIKLSLLERQRAITLKLEPTSQDGHISRSLESLYEGLQKVTAERIRLEEAGETSKFLTLSESEHSLKLQYEDLASQFTGTPTSTATSTLTHPNDPSLASDFTHATQRLPNTTSSSFLKKSLRNSTNIPIYPSPKSVRFSDSPLPASDPDLEAARTSLFPSTYRDDPAPSAAETQSQLDNQQIHAYHSQVLAEQDEALDRLGASIGRQRELSIQIGDELDEHVQMLDEVDRQVDRHTNTLGKARRNLGTVARKAKDNASWTVIVVLIVILVLLIIITK